MKNNNAVDTSSEHQLVLKIEYLHQENNQLRSTIDDL
jgi:hypothetical protein